MKKLNKSIEENLIDISNNLEDNLEVKPYQKEVIYNKYLDNNKTKKAKLNFKKIWWIIPACLLLITILPPFISNFIPKGAAPKGDYYTDSYIYDAPSYSKRSESTDIGGLDITPSDYDPSYDDTSKESASSQIQAGKLSASAYNDNDYYTFWKKLNDQSDSGALFYSLNKEYGVSTLYRVKVLLPKDVTTFVKLYDDNQKIIFQGMPDANGICYLFSDKKLETYHVGVEYYENGIKKTNYYDTTGELDLTSLQGDNLNEDLIEICLVLDATGSMCDEMEYLIAELKNVLTQVKEQNNNVPIKIAILVYRDEGDDYVVKANDFTTDIDSACKYLGKQEASGGGDMPEAVHTAFKKALSLSWTNNNSTKILIHVADAPSHEENRSELFGYVKQMSEKGIQIITLQASSADLTSEYELRIESLLTNGYYTYLTDDSGIGNSHSTPKTEITPIVEYVNAMLIRIINGIYTGTYAEPVAYNNNTK